MKAIVHRTCEHYLLFLFEFCLQAGCLKQFAKRPGRSSLAFFCLTLKMLTQDPLKIALAKIEVANQSDIFSCSQTSSVKFGLFGRCKFEIRFSNQVGKGCEQVKHHTPAISFHPSLLLFFLCTFLYLSVACSNKLPSGSVFTLCFSASFSL